jgi:hypothetical protein
MRSPRPAVHTTSPDPVDESHVKALGQSTQESGRERAPHHPHCPLRAAAARLGIGQGTLPRLLGEAPAKSPPDE